MASLGTLDDVVEMLEASGDYRCLRRVPEPQPPDEVPDDPQDFHIGIVVDVEATGPDPYRDVPIEIAMIKFAYDRHEGRILGVLDILLTQGEPPAPLSPEIVSLVGLTDSDLRGQRIDEAAVARFTAEACLVCSHHAAYDRVIIERNLPSVPVRPWACSLNDIPWKSAEGQFDRRLKDLLSLHGLFASGHRAMADCKSLLHVLGLPLPVSRRNAFAVMLETARKATAVFFAEGAPYERTPLLRGRGYRWLDGRAGAPRCWARHVPIDEAGAEAVFLFGTVYPPGEHGRCKITLLSAVHRYRSIDVIAAARITAPYLPPPFYEGAPELRRGSADGGNRSWSLKSETSS